jgi:hypothetical protein
MTDTPAQMVHIKVVCISCSAVAYIWIYPEEIEAMHMTQLPLEQSYAHVCGKCLYQRVPDDAPIVIERNADPERAVHSKRSGGGLHRDQWHAGGTV